ncbi:MAG: hypothetical protein WA063_05500 [Minisyncoccia bacterium]
MFNVFKKKEEKDSVCGMVANEKFISKYGKKFCFEDCVKIFEEKRIDKISTKSDGCGCCQ